jgi:hypothetical protein
MESTIRLDVVADTDGRFLEIISMYDFGHNYVEISDNDFIDGLIADYKEQIGKHNYFKAIKRIFLIMKVKDKKNKMIKKLIDYLNTPIGLLYRLKSDLETTLLVINKNNLDYIKESLSSFDIKNFMINIKQRTKKQIEMYIKKQIIVINEELNRDVSQFVKQNK